MVSKARYGWEKNFDAQIINYMAWQATILPLNQRCLTTLVGTYSIMIHFALRELFSLRAHFSLSFIFTRAKESEFALVCKLYAPYYLPPDIAY